MDTTNSRIDWSQLWSPGPRRAYTADEMALAGSDPPSPTLLAMAVVNAALFAIVVLQLAPPAETARLTAVLTALVASAYGAARWLWWRPWRAALTKVMWAASTLVVGFAALVRWRLPDAADRLWFAPVVAVGAVGLTTMLWFLVVWRSQQIELRLREIAEREKAIEMARRLATAQIEPHFLFNTLASVQHWAQTHDERAAPLLAALTGYLRATLPLFRRPLLTAGEELVAVERYLQVMQARMGARLTWHLDVDDRSRQALLPPGVLLTLVENAVVHGIEPQLAGGRIRIAGRADGSVVRFEIDDDGRGPPEGFVDGVGLANIRQRLASTSDPAASLALGRLSEGGCRAELTLPQRADGGPRQPA